MSNFLPMFCGAAILLVVAPALLFALIVRYTPLIGSARSHRIIRLSIMVIGGLMTFVIVFELSLGLSVLTSYSDISNYLYGSSNIDNITPGITKANYQQYTPAVVIEIWKRQFDPHQGSYFNKSRSGHCYSPTVAVCKMADYIGPVALPTSSPFIPALAPAFVTMGWVGLITRRSPSSPRLRKLLGIGIIAAICFLFVNFVWESMLVAITIAG